MRYYVHMHNSGWYAMSKGMRLAEAGKKAHEWIDLGGERMAEVSRGSKGPVIAQFFNAQGNHAPRKSE